MILKIIMKMILKFNNPIEFQNGAVAPAKTPSVAAAEAAHFAAKGKAIK